jgi:hypothetical protein
MSDAEQLFIDNLDFDVNTKVKKTSKEYSKEYYEKNKEKLREYHKNYHRKKRADELKNRVVVETLRDEENKYHNGKIYKLTHLDKMIYIGSTTVPLETCLEFHKEYSKKHENKSKIYKYIRENADIKIELIQEYKCENKQELVSKEGEYIMKYKSEILNEKVPIIY